MLGRTHALSGAVTALAAAELVNTGLGYVGLSAVEGWAYVPYVVAATGGAMLPDMDHRHATVAQSLGPVTKAAAIGIETISGGHRQGTHSILGVVAFTVLTYFIAGWNPWAYGAWAAFLVAISSAAMFQKFRLGTAITHTVITLAAGVALVWLAGTTWLPVPALVGGVAIGAIAHLIGDALTKQGVPLLWPLGWRFRLARITTGSSTENVIFALLVVALVALVGLAVQ